MNLSNRLQRLEQRIGDPGCPACRERRGQQVFVDVQRQTDGEITYGDDMPQPCRVCGRVPEFIIEIVEETVAAHPFTEP